MTYNQRMNLELLLLLGGSNDFFLTEGLLVYICLGALEPLVLSLPYALVFR